MGSPQAMIQRQAPCADRCIAAIIDSVVTGILSMFLCIPGLCYAMFKDGIREGQSFGKGMMGLRVVNLTTGRPAAMGDSCLRNCCDLCVCVLLLTEGRRHVGDLIAGTIVIKDQ